MENYEVKKMKKKAAVVLTMLLMSCCVPQMLSLAEPSNNEVTEEEESKEEDNKGKEETAKEEENEGEEKTSKEKGDEGKKETSEEEEDEGKKEASKEETKENDREEKKEEKEEEEVEEKEKEAERKAEESKPEDFTVRRKVLQSYSGNSKIARIPDSVEEIADEALKGNSIVEELYISNSVTSAGVEAFSEMNSLKKVHLGNGFEADFVDIFMGSMNIEEFETDRQDGDFYAKDGVLYVNSEVGFVAYYPAAKTDAVYRVPDNVSIVFLNGNRYIQTLSLSGSVKRVDFNGGVDVDIVPAQLRQITVDAGNLYFYVDGAGALKDKTSDTEVFSPSSAGSQDVEQ